MIEPQNKDPFAYDDAAQGEGRRWLPWVLGLLLIALLGGAWYLWSTLSETAPPGTTLSSAPKPGMPPPAPGGTSAPSGPAGSGTVGPSGTGSAAGSAGAPGANGLPGTPGPMGVPGAPGVAGTTGATGGSGAGGTVGAAGSAGAPGAAGTTGLTGAAGGANPPGSAGASGSSTSGTQAGPATAGAERSDPGLITPRYPIERSLAGAGPIDPGAATLDPPAADKAISNALNALPSREQILRFALPSEVVRRVVLTIDNLPGDTMSMQYRAVNATGGPIRIERKGPAVYIAAANAGRYDEFVKMATTIDTRRLVGLYKRFYPLFQQEYSAIGYPDRHFNDRVVEAIDDMLATPIPEGPIELIQPRVLYEYADPSLERRSVGQRMLMRMGAEHAQKLKLKLREIRSALTNESR